jgi:putative ABC transport system substrate-binding protein
MRRRDFISILGAASVAWPLAARAQQPAMPVIGFLSSGSPGPFAHLADAFRQGLTEADFVERRNVTVEYRWAESRYDRLPALAVELVSRQVAVIAATGGDQSAVAAKSATTKIPIVFSAGADPVKQGLVASLNRPGGNLTGTFFLTAAIEAKRLGLLSELAPNADVIGALVNPNSPEREVELHDIPNAARAVGKDILILKTGDDHEINAAFATLAQRRIGALFVASDPFFTNRRAYILALAARYSIPAIYYLREFAAAGGLMSYGASLADAYRHVGIYTGRILKGEKPADLPIIQPTKYELVINLKTAKALGLTVPDKLLALADEVIE